MPATLGRIAHKVDQRSGQQNRSGFSGSTVHQIQVPFLGSILHRCRDVHGFASTVSLALVQVYSSHSRAYPRKPLYLVFIKVARIEPGTLDSQLFLVTVLQQLKHQETNLMRTKFTGSQLHLRS